MIVGHDIINNGYIIKGDPKNLKHSTYDLTVGAIIPIGKEAIKKRRDSPALECYYLEPREMVWVLSKEEFNLPSSVTGMATLKTSFTKQGILALNVGIIDPKFSGPISTALINFSDTARRINVEEPFFRVSFFEHDDVSAYHGKDENTERAGYLKHLETISYREFSSSFLNIPDLDGEYYYRRFWSLIWKSIIQNKKTSGVIFIFLFIFGWFIVDLGFLNFLPQKIKLFNDWISGVKPKV